VVDDPTLDALRRARAAERRLLLVTGRELPELLDVFPHCDLFERVVAENGALLYDPATRDSRLLATPTPPTFIAELNRRGVPVSVGRAIVATVKPFETLLLQVIRDLGLEWHVIFNKESVMALPSSINKAAGLTVALEELKIPADRMVGVGDAENDHAFLHLCGFSAAVANALPSLKEAADLTLTGARGAGVAELIARLLADDLPRPHPRTALP
jgi:hydroxymethylpyrimidine pyrophosphatase-like HAD family hydrolase